MKYQKHILWTVMGFGKEEYPAGKKYFRDNKNKSHTDVITLHVTLKGEIVLHTLNQDIFIPEGFLMICRDGDDSSYEKADLSNDYACLWISLNGAGLAEHYEALRQDHGIVFNMGLNHPTLRGIRRLCELTNPREPAEPLVMAAAIHRLTMALYGQVEVGFCGQLSPVNQAIHQIVSSPLHPWNIKELAAQCGCSREYFSRTFKKKYKKSPQEYLMLARTERALYLLKHTALPVSAIVAQTGFPSSTALSGHIQSITGQSPQQLRPADSPIPRGRFRGLFDESKLS
ncbi:MAG: helix-turn-helix transcriptional regulator [Kiritimatiellales bacterium]